VPAHGRVEQLAQPLDERFQARVLDRGRLQAIELLDAHFARIEVDLPERPRPELLDAFGPKSA
jgi:hypothetical protein